MACIIGLRSLTFVRILGRIINASAGALDGAVAVRSPDTLQDQDLVLAKV